MGTDSDIPPQADTTPWLVCLRSENQVQQQQQIQPHEYNLLEQLPEELIDSIAKKLPLFDYWNFRATSKMLQTALHPTPEWRTPSFVYNMMSTDEAYLQDPRQNRSCSTTLCIANYSHQKIMASSRNGWLFIRCADERYAFRIEFYNLFTKKRITFPTEGLKGARCIRSVGFSSNPTSDDCLTVLYCSGAEPNSDSILYFSFKDRIRWERYELEASLSIHPSSVVCHKDAFYIMDKFGYLGVFKLVDGKPHWRFRGKCVNLLNEDGLWLHSNHLVECNGDLLAVLIGIHRISMTFGVKVLKCDGLEHKWIGVESIGDHSLVIGPSSFSFAAKEHDDMRERIYLPMIKDDGIVYYSLVTREFYVGSKISKDIEYARKPWNHCWV